MLFDRVPALKVIFLLWSIDVAAETSGSQDATEVRQGRDPRKCKELLGGLQTGTKATSTPKNSYGQHYRVESFGGTSHFCHTPGPFVLLIKAAQVIFWRRLHDFLDRYFSTNFLAGVFILRRIVRLPVSLLQ